MLKLPCHCYVSVQCMSIYLVIRKKALLHKTKPKARVHVAWHGTGISIHQQSCHFLRPRLDERMGKKNTISEFL
jgi:hypothetical protein